MKPEMQQIQVHQDARMPDVHGKRVMVSTLSSFASLRSGAEHTEQCELSSFDHVGYPPKRGCHAPPPIQISVRRVHVKLLCPPRKKVISKKTKGGGMLIRVRISHRAVRLAKTSQLYCSKWRKRTNLSFSQGSNGGNVRCEALGECHNHDPKCPYVTRRSPPSKTASEQGTSDVVKKIISTIRYIADEEAYHVSFLDGTPPRLFMLVSAPKAAIRGNFLFLSMHIPIAAAKSDVRQLGDVSRRYQTRRVAAEGLRKKQKMTSFSTPNILQTCALQLQQEDSSAEQPSIEEVITEHVEDRKPSATPNGDCRASAEDPISDQTKLPNRRSSRIELLMRTLKATKRIDSLYTAPSQIHGLGLFASVHLPPRSRITDFIGEKIQKSVANMREREYEEQGLTECYMFGMKSGVIDATRKGDDSRFINHCCQPNSVARIVGNGIRIYAKRTIKPGEEITLDYGMVDNNEAGRECRCAAVGCRGIISV